MIQTKAYYQPTTDIRTQTIRDLNGLQIYYDIPWEPVTTAGWIFEKDSTYGQENKMVTKPDPEFFASGNIVRSNVIPEINTNDPKYKYSRQEHTVVLY